jgi:ribosomal protein S18 acetylase RimI-like enzyme
VTPTELDPDSLDRGGSGASLKTPDPESSSSSPSRREGALPVHPPTLGTSSEPRLAPLGADARCQAEHILRATGVFREDEILVGLEVLDSSFTHPEQDYTAVGAFTPDGDLLGFTVHGPTPCTLGTWDLYWIAVSPEAQGMGIGSVLLKEVEGRLLVIETSSRPEYDPTRAFYLKRGYREVARVPDFYEAGDDRVIYTKDLTV